jgi:hypothetical protein
MESSGSGVLFQEPTGKKCQILEQQHFNKYTVEGANKKEPFLTLKMNV